jgi:dolichyl-phosphate-mannose-protein mannosyltransferase
LHQVFNNSVAFIIRVWRIWDPAEVVFDEVHFGKFASYYLERTYYFDVHPPLGKLLLAAVGYLLGYDGHYHFKKIGESYLANNVPYIGMRLFPAACGAAIVPLTFLTLKEIGFSLPGAAFGGIGSILMHPSISDPLRQCTYCTIPSDPLR